jgi:hypothetical protein
MVVSSLQFEARWRRLGQLQSARRDHLLQIDHQFGMQREVLGPVAGEGEIAEDVPAGSSQRHLLHGSHFIPSGALAG